MARKKDDPGGGDGDLGDAEGGAAISGAEAGGEVGDEGEMDVAGELGGAGATGVAGRTGASRGKGWPAWDDALETGINGYRGSGG